MLGRIQPAHFPAVFGPDGDQPLDAEVVRARFAELAARAADETGDDRGPEEVAAGFLDIAVLNMANAVKKISVQRGRDITRYALTSFGGAGGQHACAVADALGIDTVLVPPLAGVLSAYGIGVADATAMREQAVEAEFTDPAAVERVHEVCEVLAGQTRRELLDDGVPKSSVTTRARVLIRYAGTDSTLAVPLADAGTMTAEFVRAHRERYAFTMDKPLVAEAVSVEALGAAGGAGGYEARAGSREGELAPAATVRMYTAGRRRTPASTAARTCAPVTPSPVRPSSPRRTRPRSSTRAGRRPPARTGTSC